MKKLQKLEEELEFLNSSKLDDVINYVKEFSLRKKNEEILVSKFPEAVCLYITRYGLCQKAAAMVIQSDNFEQIEVLLETKRKEYNVEALFFNIGQYETIVRWLEMNKSEQYPEIDVFWYENTSKILKYIKANKVSEFGQYDLIRRGNEKAVVELILRQKLSIANMLNVALYSKKATVEKLMEVIEISKHFSTIKQIYNVRFVKGCGEMLQGPKRLNKQVEDLFFELGSIEEIVQYAERYRLTNIEFAILKRKNREGVITYVIEHKLSDEGETLLLKTCDFWEVLCYINAHELSPSSEEILIGRGNHNHIMRYLSKHSLSDKGQKALIKRGNHEEIMKFVAKYPLCDCAEWLLWKYGYDDEIETYFERKAASGQTM